ncbi:hypothetical protein Btru_001471 [Bulinus truncatus]|nr:hypothetical protein Btru_001471 [Bulinus truncatus]
MVETCQFSVTSCHLCLEQRSNRIQLSHPCPGRNLATDLGAYGSLSYHWASHLMQVTVVSLDITSQAGHWTSHLKQVTVVSLDITSQAGHCRITGHHISTRPLSYHWTSHVKQVNVVSLDITFQAGHCRITGHHISSRSLSYHWTSHLKQVTVVSLSITSQAGHCQQGNITLADTLIKTTKSNQTKAQYIGKIIQVTFDARNYSVAQFLGIPYAKPPVRERRFSLPEAFEADDDTYDATEFKNICVQKKDPTNSCQRDRPMDEDCLYLNVYLPVNVSSASRNETAWDVEEAVYSSFTPVYVFIHGGAFFRGNGNCYDPSKLAAFGEIIVVTVNYRLGALGFASTNDDVIPGNMGLWDQMEAIKWVNRHIRSFGGDPSQVTVGGQSAGSYSSLFQAFNPSGDRLFQRIIAESGTPAARNSVSKVGYETTMELAKALGCGSDILSSPAGVKQCLMQKNATELAETVIPSLVPSSLPFQPTLDDKFISRTVEDYLSRMSPGVESPASLSGPSSFTDRDLLMGYVAEDGEVFYRLWTILLNPEVKNDTTRFEAIHRTINMDTFRWISFQAIASTGKEDIADYDYIINAILDRYVDWEKGSDPNATSNSAVKMLTDAFFAVPLLEVALSHSAVGETGNSEKQVHRGRTFVYKFQLPTTNKIFQETGLSWFEGTDHSAEIPYVFGWESEPHKVEMSKAVMTYWSNFIKYGDPNRNGTINSEMSNEDMAYIFQSDPYATWEEFTSSKQSYLFLSSESETRERPVANGRHFWKSLIPRLMQHSRDMFAAGARGATDRCNVESTSSNAGSKSGVSAVVLALFFASLSKMLHSCHKL